MAPKAKRRAGLLLVPWMRSGDRNDTTKIFSSAVLVMFTVSAFVLETAPCAMRPISISVDNEIETTRNQANERRKIVKKSLVWKVTDMVVGEFGFAKLMILLLL